MTTNTRPRNRQRTLFSFRLRSHVCDQCDHWCGAVKLLRCPVCYELFDSRTQLDLWEVYDDCAICPAAQLTAEEQREFELEQQSRGKK